MLSADVLYDNVPFPDIVGRENVREFHAGFGVGTDFTVEATRIAAAEDVLLNERIRTPTLCLFNKRPRLLKNGCLRGDWKRDSVLPGGKE